MISDTSDNTAIDSHGRLHLMKDDDEKGIRLHQSKISKVWYSFFQKTVKVKDYVINASSALCYLRSLSPKAIFESTSPITKELYCQVTRHANERSIKKFEKNLQRLEMATEKIDATKLPHTKQLMKELLQDIHQHADEMQAPDGLNEIDSQIRHVRHDLKRARINIAHITEKLEKLERLAPGAQERNDFESSIQNWFQVEQNRLSTSESAKLISYYEQADEALDQEGIGRAQQGAMMYRSMIESFTPTSKATFATLLFEESVPDIHHALNIQAENEQMRNQRCRLFLAFRTSFYDDYAEIKKLLPNVKTNYPLTHAFMKQYCQAVDKECLYAGRLNAPSFNFPSIEKQATWKHDLAIVQHLIASSGNPSDFEEQLKVCKMQQETLSQQRKEMMLLLPPFRSNQLANLPEETHAQLHSLYIALTAYQDVMLHLSQSDLLSSITAYASHCETSSAGLIEINKLLALKQLTVEECELLTVYTQAIRSELSSTSVHT